MHVYKLKGFVLRVMCDDAVDGDIVGVVGGGVKVFAFLFDDDEVSESEGVWRWLLVHDFVMGFLCGIWVLSSSFLVNRRLDLKKCEGRYSCGDIFMTQRSLTQSSITRHQSTSRERLTLPQLDHSTLMRSGWRATMKRRLF